MIREREAEKESRVAAQAALDAKEKQFKEKSEAL